MYNILAFLIICTSLTAQVTHVKGINKKTPQINFSAPTRKYKSYRIPHNKTKKPNTTRLLTAQQATLSSSHKEKLEKGVALSSDIEYENIAMIVEPRQHRSLEPVIKNCYEHLGWPVVLFHGTENLEFIKSSPYLANLLKEGTLILKDLGVENLSIDSYSDVMLSESTWKSIPAENILVFQTDVIICGNNETIQPFLQYDYVGAPWGRGIPTDAGPTVGNGGLSFRKKSAMLRATKAINNPSLGIDKKLPEDVVFARLGTEYNEYLLNNHLKENFVNLATQKKVTSPKSLVKLNLLNIPNAETAGEFSAERYFSDPLPFGVHDPVRYHNKNNLSPEFISYCPDINILYD